MRETNNKNMNSGTDESKVKLTSDEKSLLRDARNSGLNIYITELGVTSSINREDFKNIPVLKYINDIGMLVLVTPGYTKFYQSDVEKNVTLKIVFITDKKIEEITNPLLKSLKPFEEDLFLNRRDFKILIIEDNPVALLLQRTIMSQFGICDSVSDGKKALELLTLSLEEKSPYDIILLDLVIPGIEGEEVLLSIRRLEDSKNIKGLERSKVIVVTSSNDTETLMDLFRAETDAYIIKPLTKEKIEKEMRNLRLI
jgi:two-component system chemotaxis response regulator CheY